MRTIILRVLPFSLALLALSFAPACSDDGGDGGADGTSGDGDGDGDGGGDGVTDCTPPGLDEVLCQAGQYCADQVLGLCENGCLSNTNCASDQECIKEDGEDVGTCQNTDTTTTGAEGPTLEEFCDKALACDPSGTMAECEMIYNGTIAECHQCFVDSNCGDIVDGVCDEACGF